MFGKVYYKKNRDVILNRAKYDYNNNIEILRESKTKYRELPEEEEIKKIEYTKRRYHNFSEEKKQRLRYYLVEYQKKYREAKK